MRSSVTGGVTRSSRWRHGRSWRSLALTLVPVLLVPGILSVVLVTAGPAGAAPPFTPGDLVVYRVGTGSNLTSASAPVFLDEYNPQGALQESVAMPTTTNLPNYQFTASGSANSEGLLTLSADGNYLMATGYDTGVNTASVSGTAAAATPRVVARIDASGNIDTSTALTDFADGNNPRGATSTNGTNIWVGGAAGGVRYTTLGSTTSTSLNAGDKNVRQVSIFGQQLYTSADPTKQSVTVATVGTGLPTTTGQSINNLSFSTAPSEPFAYVFMTLGSGPGPDTLYVADNGTNEVERFNLVSGTWTAAGTATLANVTGLTGVDTSGTVHLYATESGSNGESGKLFSITDASGVGGTLTAPATTIASAPNNEAFRGVAFAPGTNLGPGGGGGGSAPTISTATSGLPAALGDPTNATMPITVGDTNYTPSQLTVTADSSNTSVAADNGISITGSGADRILSVTPGSVGLSTITLTVTAPDASATSTTVSYGVSSEAPDPSTARYYSGAGNASSEIDVGGGYMLVGDDESDVLRLYQDGVSGPPVKTFDFTSLLPYGSTEIDIEASARAGNRIYWEGSMSNDAEGNLAPARSTLFATDITGSGASTNLTYVGSYTGLRQDLINWDQNNGNPLGLADSAQTGVPPHESDAFNAEGLEFAAGSTTTAYLGFRAPLEPPDARADALLVPITNINDLVTDGNPGTTTATFGTAFEMDLGGLGIREIRKNADNQYLIIAGASDESPGQNLYVWDGVPTDPPREALTSLSLGADRGNWEGINSMPDPLVAGASVGLVQDDGDTDWYNSGLTSKNGLDPDLQKDLGDTFTYEPPAPLATTTTLGSSENPSAAGDLVTYTATVTATNTPPAGARPPSGSIEFTDGGTDISGCASVTLDDTGAATCSVRYGVEGSHEIVATYGGGVTGDDTYSGSTSNQLTQGVGLDPSTTTLTASANPVGRREPLTYTATVTGTGPPTGTVEFTDAGIDITGCASVALNAEAVATCTVKYNQPTSKHVPAQQITANYSGDDANTTSSDSLTETVQKRAVRYTTTTAIGTASSMVTAGQRFAVTADVSTAAGVVTGKVRFLDGTKKIKGCSAVKPNASGVATCQAVITSSGTADLSAHFLGDKFDGPSASGSLPVTVNAAGTDTTVTSSDNPVSAGAKVTFTAAVTSPGGGTPTGNVAFSVGGVSVPGCTAVSLTNAGKATCKITMSTSGSPVVEASYAGSSEYGPSSGTFQETVDP